MSIKPIELTVPYVGEIAEKRQYSQLVSEYYESLYDDTRYDGHLNKADRLRNCNLYWFFDHYKKSAIMDLKTVSLCGDKFCANCAKMKQATRLNKFSPALDKIAQEYDLYHMVLTVPNPNGKELKSVINTMLKKFKSLIRYFYSNLKIRGIDFEQYGYVGAVRGLEITYKGKSDEYHPHIHCILALKQSLELDKHIYNTFSRRYNYNGKRLEIRRFSDLEILIQKIWYLLMNDQRVTLDNINSIKLGYSCMIDKIDKDSYYEVFKYATKTESDADDFKNGDIIFMTYEQFKVLYNALDRRRTIQGYGLMYNMAAGEEIEQGMDNIYDEFIAYLKSLELPELTGLPIDKVLHEVGNNKRLTYVSRRILDQLQREGRIEQISYKTPMSPGELEHHRNNLDNYYKNVRRKQQQNALQWWEEAAIQIHGSYESKQKLREIRAKKRDLALREQKSNKITTK